MVQRRSLRSGAVETGRVGRRQAERDREGDRRPTAEHGRSDPADAGGGARRESEERKSD